jgi:uncharacterized protein YdhG (YjbR/CyaY superfamily)
MLKEKIAVATTDDYISQFPKEVALKLKSIRDTIKKAAPAAEECISYGMPAFRVKGPLVYFAGYKNHIGFYPTASGIKNFTKELEGFEVSKGTIRLSLDKPLPLDLIRKITKFRLEENLNKAALKRK